MFAVITLCAGILSASPGCRVIVEPLRDVAASELNCTVKAQELIAKKMLLYPDTRPGRWGCRHRQS